VQAYVSPPIAAVFLMGITWRRVNAQGALSSLLVGFALGATRFILEVIYAGQALDGALGWFVSMNFLHFAILMFVVCLIVLIGVSLVTPAPSDEQLAGLTFQTISTGMVEQPARLAGAFAIILLVVLLALWTYFA
jgi:solute:Na+ symporter, SSS family